MPTDPQNTIYPVEKEYGADHYDVPINANFNKLARNRTVIGPIADRPAPSNEFAPAIYYSDDINTVSYNTGLSWEEQTTKGTKSFAAPGDDLQAELNALADGEELVILPGIHPTDGGLSIPNGVTVTINGEIHLNDGIQDHIIHSNGLTNTHIRGTGKLVGNKDSITDSGSLPADFAGIRVFNAGTDIYIEGIEIENTLSAGINISQSVRTTIDSVTIRNTGLAAELADGMHIRGENIRIHNCFVKNVRDSHIAIGKARKFVITGNILYNTDAYNTTVNHAAQCIGFSSSTEPCQGVVAGNSMGNPGAPSRILTDFDSHSANQPDNDDRSVAITGNYLWGTALHGAHLVNSPDTTVVGNVLELATADVGIRFGRGIVAHNTVRGAAVGIDTVSGQGNSVVAGNHVYAPGQNGIVALASECQVTDNRVEGAGNTGIIIGAGTETHTGYVVTGNAVTNSGADGFKLFGTVTDSTFVGNRADSNSGFGINIASTSDHNAYVGNVLRGNTNGGFGGTLGANSEQAANIT